MINTFNGVSLEKIINGKVILNGVTIKASAGKVISLLGPNGAGKTTCFSILCGLIKPTSGKVLLNGHDITDLPMYKRARLGIGYLPQESSIFRGLTVAENILTVLEYKYKDKKKQTEELERVMDVFSISHLRNDSAVVLSGGERRRLEIARAIANSPKFLLLDEPLAGIDPISIADMKNVINQLKSIGIGVIITEHNVRDVLDISDYSYIIHAGKVIAEGTTDEIINDEKAISMYFGKSMFT